MKHRIIKATILLLLLLPSSLPASMDFFFEESLSQSLGRMESLYSEGKWDEAMHVGRGILKDSPKEHKAARRASDLIILSLDGKNRELVANQKRAQQKKRTESSQQLITEGSKLLSEKSFTAAAEKFGRAVRLHAGDSQSYFLLGYAQLKAGRRKEAYNSLKQCLKLNPNHSRALFHIAGLSYEFNHSDEAEQYSAALISAIEKKLDELKDVFTAQRSKGLNDNAIATSRQMAALRNNLAQASFMHGVLTHKRKDYKTAVKSFEKATRLNPGSSENWFHLGSCFLHLKVYHQATLALEQSVLIKETRLREISSQAGRLLDSGKKDEAVAAELETRKLKQEIARGLYALAIAHGRKKETSNAISSIDRALELNPDFIEARYARAILLADNNNLEEALEQVRIVLKGSPPKSEQAKKAIKTITVLMDMIARRDNPVAVAASRRPSTEQEVNETVKNLPGMGGKAAEVRLEDVFVRLREINRLVVMRNHAEAVRRLLYLRTQHPDIADIHAILGHCYMEMGRIDDAALCFEQAILIDANHAEALNNLAYVLATKVEKLDRAIEYINRALAKDSLRAEFHHTHGWVLFKTGEVQRSTVSFIKAIELKPNYLLARYNLGLAFYIMQNFKGALDAFDGVLSINPHHHKALLFKSISQARTNDAEGAIKTLEDLRGRLTEKSVLSRVVTDLHARLKLAHERHAELPIPVIKSPAPIEKLMKEAMEFRSKGLVTRAKEKYLECQRLAPERFEPWFALGEMYAEAGLNVPALSAWERAEKLNPENFPLQMNLGKMHHKLGRHDRAREFFTRAQALEEKHAEPRYYLGLLAYEKQNFESAESYALSALRLKPDFYKSMALLGMARVRLNRLKPARDIYETLYAKAPTNSSIRRHARKKIWEITRQMAPAQFPSVEDAMEVKNQMVKKVTGGEKESGYKPLPSDEKAYAEYGKNTMTIEDKAWVLKQLEKFGSVATPSPAAPLRKRTSDATMTSKEKQWMVKKLQSIGDRSGKYSLPQETRNEKFSLKTTAPTVTRTPDKADNLVRAGLENAEKGFIQPAIAEFEKARTVSPDHLDNLLNLGYLHTIQGNFKTAFEAYAHAVFKHPDEPLARLALGNLYWLGGQAEKAVEQWRKIKGDFRPDKDFSILKRAEKIWQRMLEINPVDSDAHSNLGMVYLFSGEVNKALVEFKAVANLENQRHEYDFYQAQIYVFLYLTKNNRNHKKEAEQILARLTQGSEPFPHSERLKNFVNRM